MKNNAILLFLCTLPVLLLCGCGAGAKAPSQAETGGEPLDLTAFSFQHTASSMDGCFCLQLTREEDGTHLYAEEQFSGGRVVDTMIDDSALEELGALAGRCGVAGWDGFDKRSKRGADGGTFTLNLTLSDGSTVSAHGSNRFPDHYAEVFSAVKELYTGFMEAYAPLEEQAESGAVTDHQDSDAAEGGNAP